MTVDCVVLDFDGTLTLVEKEGEAFPGEFCTHLGDMVGRDVTNLWQEAQAQVFAQAPELGWEMGGYVVAPADADPYILASSTAQLVMNKLGVLKSAALRTEVIQSLYRVAYQSTVTAFRPDAIDVLKTLFSKKLPVFFVTNATTAVVKHKLNELWPEALNHLTLIGDAKKFIVREPSHSGEVWAQLPKSQQVQSLSRPIFLHRGAYIDALHTVWSQSGAKPENTIICGDIVELDLTLPAALGAQVHWIERPRSHAYEHQFIKSLGHRGGSGTELKSLLARIPLTRTTLLLR